jgi:hypothetical protein
VHAYGVHLPEGSTVLKSDDNIEIVFPDCQIGNIFRIMISMREIFQEIHTSVINMIRQGER